MPKRSYPFDNDNNHQPQCKIYINDKLIDINNEDSLKNVYSKTLEKLFKGANAKKDIETKEDILRDVFYDCNICKSCSIITTKCWFCENKLCKSCEKLCNNCKEIFCESCSLIMYEKNNDITCLNCINN